MVNPESFVAGLGHAATISRAAERIADLEIGTGWTWGTGKQDGAKRAPSRSERLLRAVDWAGNHLIVMGTWLKVRSGQASY